jgi:hypothetical protein
MAAGSSGPAARPSSGCISAAIFLARSRGNLLDPLHEQADRHLVAALNSPSPTALAHAVAGELDERRERHRLRLGNFAVRLNTPLSQARKRKILPPTRNAVAPGKSSLACGRPSATFRIVISGW